MRLKQAANKWEVPLSVARNICKDMSVDPQNIPESLKPVYHRDKRYTKNPHRYYVFLLDVISNTHLELEGIDNDILETCVEQLRNEGLIVLKRGKPIDSFDYHDFIISPQREIFYNWQNYGIKKKIELLTPIVQAFTDSATALAVAAMKSA